MASNATPATIRSQVNGYNHGRVPRPVRERQLLDLAEQLFIDRGYEGASIEELARAAGVSSAPRTAFTSRVCAGSAPSSSTR
jgi:hypothetical protein